MADADSSPAKNSLIAAAERVDRSRALLSGDLRKRNSAGKWQKRYFQILPSSGGVSFLVYFKTAARDAQMLAAMDLSRAGRPELVDGGGGGVFAITWDRYRTFQAANREEAGRWVDAILRVQAQARREGIPAPPSSASTRAAMGTVPEWGGKDGTAQRLADGGRGGGGSGEDATGARKQGGGSCCSVI